MKRFMVLLIAALLLFMGIAAAEDEMDEIVRKLEGYLDELSESEGKAVNTMALEECLGLLEEVKAKQKKPLELYCKVLLSIERNQFEEANQYMYVLQNPSMMNMFDEYFVKRSGGDTSICPVQELADYLLGRKYEFQEEYIDALDVYVKCVNGFDVYDRLENTQLMLYFSAIDQMTEGDYEGARSILEKLEQMYYPEAIQLLKSFPTPTPAPTFTPTPVPTSTPTPRKNKQKSKYRRMGLPHSTVFSVMHKISKFISPKFTRYMHCKTGTNSIR